MKINLTYLKFHYFSYSEKLHNYVKKNNELLKENEIIKNLTNGKSLFFKLKNKLKEQSRTNNLLKNKHEHRIGNEDTIRVEKVLNEHPKLKREIEQISEDKDFFYYQYNLGGSIRLISFCCNDTIYPILFDLNHLIIKSNDKNHNDKSKFNKKWDLKKIQEEIKENFNDIKNITLKRE